MGNSLVDKSIKGASWSLISTIGININKLVPLMILSRLLDKADFGIMGTAIVIISFVELFVFIGVGPAIIQKKVLSQKDISTGFSISLVMGLAIGVILFMISGIVASFFESKELIDVLKFLSLIFLLHSITMVSESLLMKEMRFKELSYINLIASFTSNLGVSVLLAYLGFGYWSIVIGYFSQAVIKGFFLFHKTYKVLGFGIDRESMNSIFSYGGGITVSRVFTHFALNGDNFLVAKLMGIESLGLYSRAYNLMKIPSSFYGTVIDTVLFPSMSSVQDELPKLSRAMLRIQTVIALLGMVLGGFLLVFSEEVVLILLGAKWVELTPIVQIMGIGVFFRTGQKSLGTISRTKAAIKELIFIKFIFAALVVSATILGSNYSLEYVALGILVANIFHFILLSNLGLGLVKTTWWKFFQAHIPGLIYATATTLMLWIISIPMKIMNCSPILILLVGVMTHVMVSILVYFLNSKFHFLPKELQWWLDKFLKKRKKLNRNS